MGGRFSKRPPTYKRDDRPGSNASVAAVVADGDPAVLYDDRNLTLAPGMLDHPVQRPGVFFDINVPNGLSRLSECLPGFRRKGSAVLSEDQNFIAHDAPLGGLLKPDPSSQFIPQAGISERAK